MRHLKKLGLLQTTFQLETITQRHLITALVGDPAFNNETANGARLRIMMDKRL